MYLPDCYSMRFTTLSNYHLIDWCDIKFFCLFTWWFDSSFFLLQQFEMGNWWIRTHIDYYPCITSEPTNQDIAAQIIMLKLLLQFFILKNSFREHSNNWKSVYCLCYDLRKTNSLLSLGSLGSFRPLWYFNINLLNSRNSL